jgi:2-(1,2-epoxy-1,2-dihydrophenyl)acetyl-CoA isomerase
MIIAAESAFFTAAYIAVGLSPDGGMTYLLPRKIGLVRTKDLILNNRKLTAREALEWGLVNKVVPDNELMKEADDIAKRFAKGPTRAYGSVKKLLNETFSETPESQMDHESRGITSMTKTKDGKEGITAFFERRRPNFTGS